jgi:thiamine biosynthesis lipoprotein
MNDRTASLLPLASLVTWLALTSTLSAQALSRHEYTERHMGVDVTLTLYAATDTAANDAAALAFARISALNRIFSDYDPESEAMRLCRDAQPGQAVPVSSELFTVLKASQELSVRSDGAFDVTIGPVVKLWRRARRQKELPDPQLLSEARQLVDFRQISLDAPKQTVRLSRSGLQLDFGGIAKGYAAQEALKTLQAGGISRALVAIAGDIAAGDPPPDQSGWKIGLAAFDQSAGHPKQWLRLANAAVSTSGDAFQFVEIAGTRYSHIVDPKTGLGLTRRSSVTVIAPNGLTADGVDTAATLLGPERGLKLIAETPGAAGLVTTLDGDRLETHTTENFQRWLWPE